MTKIIVANWKIYLKIKGQIDLAKKIVKMPTKHKIVLAPSFLALAGVKKVASKLGLAGQNMFGGDYGAYTGEVAGQDLKSLGCQYVILGHSERRKYFCETNETVNRKIIQAQKIGLIPILCVGESAEEKKNGRTSDIIEAQLKAAMNAAETKKLIVAYEPIWAIGTDNPATPEEANRVHGVIKKIAGEAVPVLYGGSVDSGNTNEFLAEQNIDGILVGRASLNAKEFAKIIRS